MQHDQFPLGPFVRLDFPDHSILYENPSEIIETRCPSDVRVCLRRLRGKESAGFISYEAGYALEAKLEPLMQPACTSDPPLLWFGHFREMVAAPPLRSPEAAWAGAAEPEIAFEDYKRAVETIRSRILDGDVYQVNFTFPCVVPFAGDPVALYAQLMERARGRWGALVFTGSHWLLSCSPELFFTLADRNVTCRPMKGTAGAGTDPETLRLDPKNRAENLMIVDLVRNDLSRLSKPGTVKVEELFAIEHYPTILQMTSSVTAELEEGLGAVDVVERTFPCGSITGAPKIRAMERIRELERGSVSPRGPYTGSIGYIGANGDAQFNVAIRTLILRAGETSARLNVGSAVVIDSDPQSEWNECLQKTSFVPSRNEFELFETFACGPGHDSRAALHLNRLERSATALSFGFDRSAIELDLQAVRATLTRDMRVKLSLRRSGTFSITTADMPENTKEKVAVAIVSRSNSPHDFRLAHKTSDRGIYDDARRMAGTFEVLFADQQGYLTEGSFTNLFVRRGDHLITPPLRRGLLAGILRERLLRSGHAIEGDLTTADLCGEFFIGNSLRGLLPAELQRLKSAHR